MDVVRDSEPEVPGFSAVSEAALENVNAGPEELDDRERQVGEMLRIGSAPTREERTQCDVVRFFGKHFTDFRCQGHDAIPSLGLAHYSAERRRSALDQVEGD